MHVADSVAGEGLGHIKKGAEPLPADYFSGAVHAYVIRQNHSR